MPHKMAIYEGSKLMVSDHISSIENNQIMNRIEDMSITQTQNNNFVGMNENESMDLQGGGLQLKPKFNLDSRNIA